MHFVNAKGILSAKNGMNIYRGCTHGCIYCDSRSTCYSMAHDFEDIEAKVRGIICFGMGVTLREGDREYFYAALDKHFPGLRYKFHKKYGYAYEIGSDNQRELMGLFKTKCKENGIMCDVNKCFEYLNEFPEKYKQIKLF